MNGTRPVRWLFVALAALAALRAGRAARAGEPEQLVIEQGKGKSFSAPFDCQPDPCEYVWSVDGGTPQPGDQKTATLEWDSSGTKDVSVKCEKNGVALNTKAWGVTVVRVTSLQATYGGETTTSTIQAGDTNGVHTETIYVPQAQQVTLTASGTPAGTWPAGFPRWGWQHSTGWTRSITNGNTTGTVTPTGQGTTGNFRALCGVSPTDWIYKACIEIRTVTVSEVTASVGAQSASSSPPAPSTATTTKNRAVDIEASFHPAGATAASTSTFRWKVVPDPAGTTYTLGSATDPTTTFASANLGTFTITGYLDVNGNSTVDTAESSKTVTVEVANSYIRFVEPNVDAFDGEDYTRTGTVDIDIPAEANEDVTLTVTRANGDDNQQHTRLTGDDAQSEDSMSATVTLDGNGRGSKTFELTEKGGIGPGVDSLEAAVGNETATATGRACGITDTTVQYVAGGVNAIVSINFYVDVCTEGVALEHYQKTQYWSADSQSVYTHRLDYDGTHMAGSPVTRQGQMDWSNWYDAEPDKRDHQESTCTVSRTQGGQVQYHLLKTDRYFIVKYRNADTGPTVIDAFAFDWEYAWDNYNARDGENWWVVGGINDPGQITRDNGITDFEWGE